MTLHWWSVPGWLGYLSFKRRLRRALYDLDAQVQLSNRYMTDTYGAPPRERLERLWRSDRRGVTAWWGPGCSPAWRGLALPSWERSLGQHDLAGVAC